jgi:hypothetical protein
VKRIEKKEKLFLSREAQMTGKRVCGNGRATAVAYR